MWGQGNVTKRPTGMVNFHWTPPLEMRSSTDPPVQGAGVDGDGHGVPPLGVLVDEVLPRQGQTL